MNIILDAVSIVLPDHHHHLYYLDDGDDGGSNPASVVPDPISFPSANNSLSSTIARIDYFLFIEDQDLYPQDPSHHLTPAFSSDEEFLSDLLLDSPLPPDPSSSEIQLLYSTPNPSLAKNSSEADEQQPTLTHQLLPPPPAAVSQPQQGEREEENRLHTNDSNNSDNADPVAKKRKR